MRYNILRDPKDNEIIQVDLITRTISCWVSSGDGRTPNALSDLLYWDNKDPEFDISDYEVILVSDTLITKDTHPELFI